MSPGIGILSTGRPQPAGPGTSRLGVRTGLGFVPHTGWAVVIAVTGEPETVGPPWRRDEKDAAVLALLALEAAAAGS